MSKTFTTMQYNRQILIIRNELNKNPVVIADCYLPETAAMICELLNKKEQETNAETR